MVGYPHDIKGHGIYAYVITAEPLDLTDKQAVDRITGEIVESVVASIGRIAKSDKIQFVSGLPAVGMACPRRAVAPSACGGSCARSPRAK